MNKNKTVCSWDVGIKNLAYSVIKKTEDGINILAWGSFNLIDSDMVKCCGKMKNSEKECGKKASYKGHSEDKRILYYCGSHKKSYNKPNIEGMINEELNNNKNCCYYYPKKGTICNKVSKYKLNNENILNCLNDENVKGAYYCKQHIKPIEKKLNTYYNLKVIKKKKATSTEPQKLANNMYKKLNECVDLKLMLESDDILIENQPSLKNPTMKTVSCFLFSYFALNKCEKNMNYMIKFISPSNKLKVEPDEIEMILLKIIDECHIYKLTMKIIKKYYFENEKITNEEIKNEMTENNTRLLVKLILKYLMSKKETLNNIEENIKKDNLPLEKTKDLFNKITKKNESLNKNIYDIIKSLSIVYTEVLLEKTKEDKWKEYMDGYKKKDDICDAYLQGLYYLKN